MHGKYVLRSRVFSSDHLLMKMSSTSQNLWTFWTLKFGAPERSKNSTACTKQWKTTVPGAVHVYDVAVQFNFKNEAPGVID